MDPALTAALFAAGTGAVSAFIAYWAGVGIAEKRHKAREAALLDALAAAPPAPTDMAIPHPPAGRHLRRAAPEGA